MLILMSSLLAELNAKACYQIVLNQIHPPPILTISLPKIHLNVILLPPSWSSMWTCSKKFLQQILYMYYPCINHSYTLKALVSSTSGNL
jgi:hypothetical protein